MSDAELCRGSSNSAAGTLTKRTPRPLRAEGAAAPNAAPAGHTQDANNANNGAAKPVAADAAAGNSLPSPPQRMTGNAALVRRVAGPG